MKIILPILLLFVLVGCTNPGSPGPVADGVGAASSEMPATIEESRQILIGTWFGESVAANGEKQMHIAQRLPNGQMKIRFRVISPDGAVYDSAEAAFWGISGDIYFSITIGWIEGNEVIPADITQADFYDAYRVLALDSERFRYRHVATKDIYQTRKVADDFDFPE